jgi:hypothetical protein
LASQLELQWRLVSALIRATPARTANIANTAPKMVGLAEFAKIQLPKNFLHQAAARSGSYVSFPLSLPSLIWGTEELGRACL